MARSRKLVSICGAASAALIACSGAAFADGYEEYAAPPPPAEEGRKFTYSFSLTGTTDYVFRGISQTDNDPTLQGSFDIGYGIFYAGIWASGVDFDDDATFEADWYAGITPKLGNFEFDFGVIAYTYPGAMGYDLVDLWEYKIGVSTSISGFSVGATAFLHPEYSDNEYYVFEGTAGYEFKEVHGITPSIDGLVGYFDAVDTALAPGGESYTYWNAGLGLAMGGLSLDFRYWDSDISAFDCGFSDICEQKFVFSATVSVP